MAEDGIAVLELPGEPGNGEFLEELGQWSPQRLMEPEAESRCGAAHHERSPDLVSRRRGYRDPQPGTRMGTLDLSTPGAAHGRLRLPVPEPGKVCQQALSAVVQEASVKGVGTCTADCQVRAVGNTCSSGSRVPRRCTVRDARVNAFLQRPSSGTWLTPWMVDASAVSRNM